MSRRKIKPLLAGASMADIRDNLLARSDQLQRAAAQQSAWARTEHKFIGRKGYTVEFCIQLQEGSARLYDTSVQYRTAANALTD